MTVTPKNVSRAGAHDVRIEWSDGHHSLYPARDLRLACSCAACVEEMTGRALLNPTTVAADVHPLGISPVGRYALHFNWSDGHTSGIYTFEHIRAQCRCSTCRPDDPNPVNPSKEAPMTTLTAESTMQEILTAYPNAQQALFARYHIGGCSSCGFQPTDTLRAVLANHDVTDVDGAIAFIQNADAQQSRLQISPEELKAQLGRVKLLDVRTAREIAEATIDGALEVTEDLSEEILNTWDKSTPIVVYCHLGQRSQQAAGFLSDRGFKNVKSLTGGIDAWSIKVDSGVPRYQQIGGGGGCKG